MPYKCTVCGSEFSSKINLKTHKNTAGYCKELQIKNGIINNTTLIKCNCGKVLATKSNLTRHKKTCSEQTFPEDVNNTQPIIHNQEIHSQELLNNEEKELNEEKKINIEFTRNIKSMKPYNINKDKILTINLEGEEIQTLLIKNDTEPNKQIIYNIYDITDQKIIESLTEPENNVSENNVSESKIELDNLDSRSDNQLRNLIKEMINTGEIKTNIDFAERFMFLFDNTDPYPINLDVLMEYKIYDRKDHAKRMLIKNFKEGTDYLCSPYALFEQSKDNIHNRGGLNNERIVLSVDCFEPMCMLARSEAGNLFRMYYVDLEKVFKRYITDKNNYLEQENIRLSKIHNSRLLKHKYYKFRTTGPCFYIIINNIEYTNGLSQIKIGIAGILKKKRNNTKTIDTENNEMEQRVHGINERLKNHRTLWNRLSVKFIVYTNDAELLEKCIKREFKENINPGGVEIIENIPAEHIIESAKAYLNSNNKQIEYKIEENLEKYNNIAITHLKYNI